jgi:hypothetical protein
VFKYQILKYASLLLADYPLFAHFGNYGKEHPWLWPNVSSEPIAGHWQVRKGIGPRYRSWSLRAYLLPQLEYGFFSGGGALRPIARSWSPAPWSESLPWLRGLRPIPLLASHVLLYLIMLEALSNLIHHLNHRMQLFINVLHILRKKGKNNRYLLLSNSYSPCSIIITLG